MNRNIALSFVLTAAEEWAQEHPDSPNRPEVLEAIKVVNMHRRLSQQNT